MPPQNQNQFFGTKVSKPGINVNNASDQQLVYKDTFNTKTYYDNSNSRMLEGQLPDGSYGLWVSKPGFDVTTATTSELTFNSNASFTIAVDSTYTFPLLAVTHGTSGSVWVTIAHDLGFVPAFDYYIPNYDVIIPGQNTSGPQGTTAGIYSKGNVVSGYPIGPFASIQYNIAAFVDATNLYFEENYTGDASTDGTLIAITVYFYIYSAQVT